MTKGKNYILGLVVGPKGIGYAVMDSKYHIIQMPLHHTYMDGVRLFKEGQTAQETRLFRGARRNNKRTKERVGYLNQILAPLIFKVDPLMFERLKESGLSPRDERKKHRSQIFDNPRLAHYYSKKFLNIFFLEKYLMTTDEKADIRLIYIALHSLETHRGHFYNTTPLSQFKPGKVDIEGALNTLNDLFELTDLSFEVKNSAEIQKIILSNSGQIPRKKKVALLQKLLVKPVGEKSLKKRNAKIVKEIINAMLGASVKFNKIFQIEMGREEAKEWTFKLDDPDLDTKIQTISSDLTPNQQLIIDALQRLYSSIALADILDGASNLPDAMIAKYKAHKHDLDLYFDLIHRLGNADSRAVILKEAYTLYINKNSRKDFYEIKKKWGKNAPRSRKSFYTKVSSIVKSIQSDKKLKNNSEIQADVSKILKKIDEDKFLLKQRDLDNIYVPYQLNALTFNAILKNQGKYYPELIKPNPCKHDINEAPYELSQLMQFTIPYYVGPLMTEEDQIKNGIPKKDRFAWMIRKEEGKITPWNFYDKVDVLATANKFIKRSIAKDTFLLSYPVLPKNSLLYQEYEVYSELSNIRIDKNRLKGSLKQWIFENVFKKHTTVTAETLKKALVNEHHMSKNIIITGFTDIKNPKFNSSLSIYNSWRKIFGNLIDEASYRADIEKMIEWSTIFEDRKILAVKLNEINWLTERQRKFVINHRLTGWGRFSKKLLFDLKDFNGKSIMYNLSHTQNNFNQIINKAAYQQQIKAIATRTTKNEPLDSILDRAYASPSDKKAIRQSMKVLNEIIDLNKGVAPSKIVIRFQRSEVQEKKLTDSQVTYLKKKFSEIKKTKLGVKLYYDGLEEELKEATNNHKSLTKKEYLYFQQLGRDAMTGELIKFDELKNYRILHIIPRRKLISNSNNNLCLTKINSIETSAMEEFGNRTIKDLNCPVKQLWIDWNKLAIISKGKLANYQVDLDNIDERKARGFLARELVVNYQISKLLATILQGKFPNSQIIEVRDDQLQAVRAWLNLYRLPVINDYYLAFDAYLSALIGEFLYNLYPKMRRYFVYGEYLKHNKNESELASENNKNGASNIKNFNLLWQLLYGRKNTTKIYNSKTPDKVLCDREELLNYINKVYNFKYCPVSFATFRLDGAVFKQTIYPRLERDTAKNRTLIPKKKGYDTSIYGGYTSNYNSYFVLIKSTIKKSVTYKFIGIPVRCLSELAIAKSEGKYNIVLRKIIKDQLKKGESFEVLKDNVPYNQVIEDGKEKFYMGSVSYRYTARQLILNADDQKVIMDTIVDPEFAFHFKTDDAFDNIDDKLVKVYQDILYQIKNYLPVMHLNKLVEKLEKGESKFRKLPLGKKKYVLSQLLLTTKCSSTSGKLKDIGIGTLAFQKLNNPISAKAKLIYQSPTGLITKTKIVGEMKALF